MAVCGVPTTIIVFFCPCCRLRYVVNPYIGFRHIGKHEHVTAPCLNQFQYRPGPSWWWAFRNTLAASPMQSGKTPPKGIGDVLVRNPGPGKISRVSVLYTEHVKERRGSFRKELGSCTRIPLYLPFFLFKCHFHALPWAKLLVVERAALKLDLKATTLSPPG